MPFGFSSSSGSSESFIAPFQEPYLRAQARKGNRLANRSLGFLQPLISQFQEQAAAPALQSFNSLITGGGFNNELLQEQVRQGQANLNENFLENILPALRRGATARGGFGASSGARGQLAESEAAGELLEAQGNLETGLRGRAFERSLDAQLQALGLAPELLNLQTGVANLPFGALLAQNRVLGGPIILNEGSSSSSGFSF